MLISPVLLVVSDTEASVFDRIGTHSAIYVDYHGSRVLQHGKIVCNEETDTYVWGTKLNEQH